MKIIGVIPARYASSRFPGKPLADISGKPMIWWIYQQVKKVNKLYDVFVAIDDDRVQKVCEQEHIKYILTSKNHPEHISRIHEVSEKIQSDYYICVNGDEPLIDPSIIGEILPQNKKQEIYFGGAMRILSEPAELIDSGNIKLVTTSSGRCIYMSRAPVPYPQKTLFFHYNKYIGIECFNKQALDFFVKTNMGNIEKIEDIDHLRFLENGKDIYFTYVNSESLSVDTPKDLEKVRVIIQDKIRKGDMPPP